jgi:hypothetical protein
MEAEHCSGKGCSHEFETLNYTKIKTSPKKEWGIVVDRIPCPQEDMKYSRRIPDIDSLLKLPLSKRANLTRHEVIAVVLYTGPMVSNGILNITFLFGYQHFKCSLCAH